jgi:DNA-binding beta-propeller fold protein YncE
VLFFEDLTMRLLLASFLIAVASSVATCAEIVTIAGTGKDEFSGDGGPALHAGLGQPFGMELGPDGALYFCEFSNHTVRRLDLKTGVVSTAAGTGRKAGYAGDGGLATKARMNQPHELRFDAGGNYYVSDMLGQAVRRVDWKTQVITTVAGTGKSGFGGDGGPATNALFDLPISVALDHSHGLLICDIKNLRVRRVDLGSGIVSTFAGTGEKKVTPDGAPLTGTPLNGPRTLAVEADGNLIIVLREGNAVFRADLKSNKLHHIAGTGKSGFAGDGRDARRAQLAGPKGVAVDRAGNILLCDTENHCVRIIDKSTGSIDTLIGDGKPGDGPDGNPKTCRLNRPHGVFVDPEDSVYVGDSSNNKVRKLTRK